MEQFKNQYRIPSARLSSWNYAWAGAYFVTLCTKDRQCYFGEIDHETMHLSTLGQIAEQCWSLIPQHFPLVTLKTSVIMPNHVHGIIIINSAEAENMEYSPHQKNQKQTQNIASLPKTQNTFGKQSGNLASVIRGFKIGVTKGAKELNTHFSWQPRFYDHIIRDHESLNRIAEYIDNNPRNWASDELYRHVETQNLASPLY